MRIGYFAPLPPAETGVADYAQALLDALCSAPGHVGDGIDVGADHAIALYHVGNNQLHREIYERAVATPGITILHDAVLQHLFLGWLDRDRYIDEFVFNYGEWTRGFAAELWSQRARSAADPRYFEYPMLKRIAERSRTIVVHNRAAGWAVTRHAPDARVIEIPHLFVKPELPDMVETLRFRQSLGIGPRTMLIGAFGHQRESKRLPVVLRALRRAWGAGADARLLVAGPFASSDLERALTPLLDDPRIIRVGYLPEREFWRYAAATDLCVNLRFPTAGETSGIAVRMMGIGKTVVFTDGQEVAGIPDNACLRVDLGTGEETMLADYMIWLASDLEAAAGIGLNAAQYVAARHSVDKVAQEFWRLFTA